MFSYGGIPNSAQAASRIFEQQQKEKQIQEQKERLQNERENRRDQVTENIIKRVLNWQNRLNCLVRSQ